MSGGAPLAIACGRGQFIISIRCSCLIFPGPGRRRDSRNYLTIRNPPCNSHTLIRGDHRRARASESFSKPLQPWLRTFPQVLASLRAQIGNNILHRPCPPTLNHPIESGTRFLLRTGRIVIHDVLKAADGIARGTLQGSSPHFIEDTSLLLRKRHANLQFTMGPEKHAAHDQQTHTNQLERASRLPIRFGIPPGLTSTGTGRLNSFIAHNHMGPRKVWRNQSRRR